MLLEVTGRAGALEVPMRTDDAHELQAVGILTDSYYSEYELADPNEPGVLPPNVTVTPASGSPTTLPMNQVQVEYTYHQPARRLHDLRGRWHWSDAVCKYHTYDENTFIDSLSPPVVNPWAGDGSTMASASNPYYGPYYDTSSTPITFTVPDQCGLAETRARRSRSREALARARNTASASTTARSPSTASRTRRPILVVRQPAVQRLSRPWSRALRLRPGRTGTAGKGR